MTHQPKGSMCISCGNANASCASRPFASMPVIKTYPDGVKAVKCTGHVHAQASTEKNAALQQVYDATQLEVDRLRGATKMMDPAGEYPPLPRPFIFAHESGGVEWPDTFDATQMRTYADATCAMRAQAAHAAVAGPSETVKFVDESTADPVEKARRYLKAMGDQRMNSAYFFDDGYTRREISQDALATLAVLEQLSAAPQTDRQPAVQQGDADVEGAIKSAFFRFFGAGAERDWHTEPGGWFIEGYRAAHPAAPVAQGDAEQRQMDAKHAAIYRWIIQHIDKAASIIDAWREDGEADKDELHDALAARAQANEGDQHG